MKNWLGLPNWNFGASNASNDKTYDEEDLRWGYRLSQLPPRSCRLLKLRKATVLFLLIDLIVVGLLLQTLSPLIVLLRRNEELFGPRVALSTPNPNAWRPMNLTGKIPRILHQTAATETIPNKWIESQQSCKEAYANFDYKVITLHTL